ncbi:MAG TPA: hypothetical protein VJQ79_04390 [Acidimicrobiia bacterium]|nr:hypothetical protein [Acidimicrobiia bacterium]
MKRARRMKRVASLAVVILGLAGCGEPATFATATTSRSLPTVDSTPTPTVSASTSSSTSVTEVGDAAPDFTLALGDGGTFVLSQEARPVYLVFWAEW